MELKLGQNNEGVNATAVEGGKDTIYSFPMNWNIYIGKRREEEKMREDKKNFGIVSWAALENKTQI